MNNSNSNSNNNYAARAAWTTPTRAVAARQAANARAFAERQRRARVVLNNSNRNIIQRIMTNSDFVLSERAARVVLNNSNRNILQRIMTNHDFVRNGLANIKNNKSIGRNLSIKANRPSGWYNTSGNLKTINKNVITSPISLAQINLKNLDKLYLDQNSRSRYLYTRDEIMKMNVNPMTRGKMAPRLLPNNIKSAINKYVKDNAATRIQTAVRGRQASGLARA